MRSALPFLAVFGGIIVVLVVLMRALKGSGGRPGHGPGPGASGAVYDMLNEDKRKAIEIIVEGRAEYTDPEHADDIPDKEDDSPRSPRKNPTTP